MSTTNEYKNISNCVANDPEIMYVDNNMKTLNKYARNNNSLFNEIINNVLGSHNENIDFDSDCTSVDMSITSGNNSDSEYTVVNFSESENIIDENYLDNLKQNNSASGPIFNEDSGFKNIIKNEQSNDEFIDNEIIGMNIQLNEENNNNPVNEQNNNNPVNEENNNNPVNEQNNNNPVNEQNNNNPVNEQNNNNPVNEQNNNNPVNEQNDDDQLNEQNDDDQLNEQNNNNQLNEQNDCAPLDNQKDHIQLIEENDNEQSSNDTTEVFSSGENSEIFFECFNDELCINNSIPCNDVQFDNSIDKTKINEMTASYMFETEDLKKNDVYPFDDYIFNMKKQKAKKPKSTLGRISVIVSSAMMLLGGSWLNSIIN